MLHIDDGKIEPSQAYDLDHGGVRAIHKGPYHDLAALQFLLQVILAHGSLLLLV